MKSPFSGLNIMVCGEVGIDEYWFAKSERNSPEANDAPVLTDLTMGIQRPGLSGNVVMNLEALGAKAELFTVLGRDEQADWLSSKLTLSAWTDKTRPTITKTRLYCNDKQIARIDVEKTAPVSKELSKRIYQMMCDNLYQFDAVIVQDYGKGLWTKDTLKFIQYAKDHNKRVFVDPYRGRKARDYRGCYLLKPNFKEAQAMSPVDYAMSFETLMRLLREDSGAVWTVVTMSERGILAQNSAMTRPFQSPSIPTNVVDVAGCGDTVLAVLTLMDLCRTYSLETILKTCNLAASLVIQKMGPATVTWSEICNP